MRILLMGHPNVGKSAVFNRLTGGLTAIFCPDRGSNKITNQPLSVDHRNVPDIILWRDFDEIHTQNLSFTDQTMDKFPRLNPI